MDKRVILFVALESELPKEMVPYSVDIHYTGVGKVNAAMKATQVLANSRHYETEDTLIMNYGSAGSTILPVGTLAECRYFVQQDMITPFGEKYSTPFDELISSKLKEPVLEFGHGYMCRTQDKFETNPNGIFDMEAYSIAKVCKLNRFDFVAYKYISDGGNSDEWDTNHSKGIEKFLDMLNELIK